ncbi:MAG TPA: site-specific DNA-methyltransferase [Anaerolineales bacterium]
MLRLGTNKKVHPTQMPINLAAQCIVFSTDERDTVLDPFSGSGTTGVACIKLSRHFIGIEREAQYVKLTLDRWANVWLQRTLFERN